MVYKFLISRGIVENNGKFLVLKKANDFISENIGKWECPGGKIVDGETPQGTVLRELKEETNITGEIVKELPKIYIKTENAESTCFVFLIKANDKKVELSNEHSEFKWIKPKEFKNLDLVKFADLLINYFEEV